MHELFEEIISNPHPRSRKKCFVVYLRKSGAQRKDIARTAGIDEDLVTNDTNKYDKTGLQDLLKENYRKPTSQLGPYTEQLKPLFNQQAPHTISQAIKMIKKEAKICMKPSTCRAFLKKNRYKV